MSAKLKLFLLLTLYSFFSCRKENTPLGKPQTLAEVFDFFWLKMNTSYLYWDVDRTNWDETRTRYHSLFSKLDIEKKEDAQQALTYFREMTYQLTDNHFQVLVTHPFLQSSLIFPSQQRKQVSPGFHFPFDYLSIDSFYFKPNFSIGYNTNGASPALQVVYAEIKDASIAYFRCNKFSLFDCYYASTASSAKSVIDNFLNTIPRIGTDLKGLIIDLRNNNGGNNRDLNFLMNKLISKPHDIGYMQYKTDAGRLDYSPWIKSTLQPIETAIKHDIPIIALVDNYTISLAETIGMTIHSLPKGKTVGEQTWGATGNLANETFYGTGSFEIPGFMNVYMSSAKFRYLDSKSYEDTGFPPSVNVPFQRDQLQAGKDPQLQAAIDLLK